MQTACGLTWREAGEGQEMEVTVPDGSGPGAMRASNGFPVAWAVHSRGPCREGGEEMVCESVPAGL